MRRVQISLLLAILAGLLINHPALANKLTLVNNSGYADKEIYLIVWGKSYTGDLTIPHHLNLLKGDDFPACDPSDNTVTVYKDDGTHYSDGYCNYWFTLDQIKKADGSYWFEFPRINSGRLYITFHKPVYLHINQDQPTDPILMREPDLNNPDDPSYKTMFDKFEFTYDTAGLHANTTCVDYFCLPLKFEMMAGETHVGTLGFPCSQAAVILALEANPLLRTLKTPYRFYSPATHTTDPKVHFDDNYFNNYINYCWNHYKTNKLTITGVVNAESFSAVGTVQTINTGGGDVETLVLDDTEHGETYNIKKPSSKQVFACGGAGVFIPEGSGNTGLRDGYIKNEVASALNRTVMHLEFSEWKDTSKHYQQNDLPDDNYKTNIYAQILHRLAINHLIYGYAWDDKYDQESYLSSETGTDLKVTINNCKAPVVPVLSLLLLDK
ncbi:MAG: hypothetical protein KJ822_15645 [Proteobacteria bacterium]|nr:hypothetical protein [Pseudomonadota bacterium]